MEARLESQLMELRREELSSESELVREPRLPVVQRGLVRCGMRGEHAQGHTRCGQRDRNEGVAHDAFLNVMPLDRERRSRSGAHLLWAIQTDDGGVGGLV